MPVATARERGDVARRVRRLGPEARVVRLVEHLPGADRQPRQLRVLAPERARRPVAGDERRRERLRGRRVARRGGEVAGARGRPAGRLLDHREDLHPARGGGGDGGVGDAQVVGARRGLELEPAERDAHGLDARRRHPVPLAGLRRGQRAVGGGAQPALRDAALGGVRGGGERADGEQGDQERERAHRRAAECRRRGQPHRAARADPAQPRNRRPARRKALSAGADAVPPGRAPPQAGPVERARARFARDPRVPEHALELEVAARAVQLAHRDASTRAWRRSPTSLPTFQPGRPSAAGHEISVIHSGSAASPLAAITPRASRRIFSTSAGRRV